MTFKITTKTDINLSKIYINDTLHLAFVRTKLLGMSSWYDFEKFTIQLVFQDGNLIVEYGNKELWKEVLNKLEKVLYP